MSISRFGDGEFDLMLNINHPKFQRKNKKLTDRLIDVFNMSNEKLLVCIPNIFTDDALDNLTNDAKKHWRRFVYKNRLSIYNLFDEYKTYGDALVTRHYIDIKNKENISDYFIQIKGIWEKRNVIIVEGRFTRFGVNNDLLHNAKSVHRILCPEKDAFDKYDEILKACQRQAFNKNVLFLLALGPKATVLAADLTEYGYQAIDIGHLDIEYEWFLHNVKKKTKVENKYVNEIDDILDESTDKLYDKKYEQSIIGKIFK